MMAFLKPISFGGGGGVASDPSLGFEAMVDSLPRSEADQIDGKGHSNDHKFLHALAQDHIFLGIPATWKRFSLGFSAVASTSCLIHAGVIVMSLFF